MRCDRCKGERTVGPYPNGSCATIRDCPKCDETGKITSFNLPKVMRMPAD